MSALIGAGLPRQRFHDLRHAHATLLIEGGVELACVSRALGHADLSTTADVYGSWTRDMAGRVASRMDDVLRRRVGAGYVGMNVGTARIEGPSESIRGAFSRSGIWLAR